MQVRGFRWNPMTRFDMVSRQAVQVALAGFLAIVLGTWLSPTRYYWAVIAAFVTFTGPGTRSETFLKGANRVAGTLFGLVAAILLAHVTVGHTVWILATILLSVFLGFYLIRISYGYLIFFITIMLGQLYTVLGTFSDSLLVLRLGETAVGAVAGVAVALLISPLSTRDTVRSARDELLVSLADVLDGVASYVGGERVDLDSLARALDDRARRLLLVAKPLTRPLVFGNRSPRTRHRISLYLATVAQSRAMTIALQRRPRDGSETIVTAALSLADAARKLTDTDPGRPAPAASEPLHRGDLALFRDAAGGRAPDPVLRQLHHLNATLTELADTSTTRAGVTAPA
ncbi:MAG: FUSC family protein [Marmoricola sp.]